MPVSTRYFTVTAPQGMSTIKLDSKGSATCQITVKNVSRAAIDGRAVLVSLPPSTKDSPGAIERNWVKIDGPAERHFAVDQEEVFSIKIAASPQKKGEAVPAGNYGFRLDVINTARPDDSGDQSQALGFTVAAVAPPTKSKLPLILIIAAVVLIVGGLTTWLLLRNSGSSSDSANTSSSTASPAPSSTPAARSTPAPQAGPWVGTWVNDNPNTRTIARIDIAQQGNGFSVHAWGKCGVGACDWTTRPGDLRGSILSAVFSQAGGVHNLNLLLNGSRLQMGYSETVNNRVVASTTETFHR